MEGMNFTPIELLQLCLCGPSTYLLLALQEHREKYENAFSTVSPIPMLVGS